MATVENNFLVFKDIRMDVGNGRYDELPTVIVVIVSCSILACTHVRLIVRVGFLFSLSSHPIIEHIRRTARGT